MTNSQTFYLAANTDYNASSSQKAGVINTGCDIQKYSTTTDKMSVFVWDGENPGFAWKYSGTSPTNGTLDIDGTGGGAITDPDVVLSHDGMLALIIYIQDNRCYFEAKKYSNGQFVDHQSATEIGTSNECTNPNVDIGYNYGSSTDYVAATWIQDNKVMGRVGVISSGNYSFTNNVREIAASDNYYTPDVCIWTNTTTAYNYVTFTYISGDHNGTHYLCYNQDFYNNLTGNNSWAGTETQLMSADSPSTLEKPRIAAPIYTTGTNFYWHNFQIVVLYKRIADGTTSSMIYGFNKKFNQLNSNVGINSSPLIYDFENRDPVVTYGGDRIIVSWVYYGKNITGYDPNEILSRQLTWDGTPATNQYYSVVNYSLKGDQFAPSVAERYSPTNEVLYCFYDSEARYIKYKHSNYSNIYLKLRPDAEMDLTIYPNPAANNFSISIPDLGLESINYSIEILSNAGQLVKEINITDFSSTIDIAELNKGLYYVRINTGDKPILKKLIISR